MDYDFRYAPTLQRAYTDDARVKIVRGPVESGKSVWLCLEIYKLICTMPRSIDGVRRSRWLIVRTTDGELQRGIMRTWKSLFPEEIYGPITGSMPSVQRMHFLDVEAEIEFFAFEDDSPTNIRKLKSTEYTGVAVNEGQYTPLRLFKTFEERAGRYPPKKMCPDFDRQKRVLMDMNAPRTNDHWTLYMDERVPLPATMSAEEKYAYNKPDDWEFYTQPPAVRAIYGDDGIVVDFEVHPDAENLPYQSEEELLNACKNGFIDDIRRDRMNEVVAEKGGKARYEQFSRSFHIAKAPLKPQEGVPPVIGYDPGVQTGAAVFGQRLGGQWRAYRELNARNDPSLTGAAAQGQRMLEILDQDFPWYRDTGIRGWIDPYGTWNYVDKNMTFANILMDMGLAFDPPAERDNPTLRHNIGMKVIRSGELGKPGLLICPQGCPTLINALDGGAVMRQVKRQNELVVENELVKNRHSDVTEALEYMLWGGGEDHRLVKRADEDDRMLPQGNAGRSSVFTGGRRSNVWGRNRPSTQR